MQWCPGRRNWLRIDFFRAIYRRSGIKKHPVYCNLHIIVISNKSIHHLTLMDKRYFNHILEGNVLEGNLMGNIMKFAQIHINKLKYKARERCTHYSVPTYVMSTWKVIYTAVYAKYQKWKTILFYTGVKLTP